MSIFKEYSRNFVNQMKLQEVDPNITQKHNKDYNWTKDYDFLRYLTYVITKKAFDQGIYDGWDNLDIVRHVADTVGHELSSLVSLYDPTHLKFRREDIKQLQNIDPDTAQRQYSSRFTDPTVQELIGKIIDKLKELNSSTESNLLVDELPADWDDKTKNLWVVARFAKYIASILPINPWRIFLRAQEESASTDHFLDSHGWAVFRSKEAAENAFQEFVKDLPTEMVEAYAQYSIGPTDFTVNDSYPEMEMLLDKINDNLPKLGLAEPLTKQYVAATRKLELSKEPYENENLNKRLNQVVIPALKAYATETQSYFYHNPEELKDKVYLSQPQGANND